MRDDVSLVIVQCRYNSKRLPGKALYPVAGVPMLVFLLRRLRVLLPGDGYEIVLATTRVPQDDPVAAWGESEGVLVVRGEENDVLGRFVKCLDSHPAETVVRVTADNPLTCPEMLQRMVWEMGVRGSDYAQCENLPYGAGSDAFSGEALKRLNREAMKPEEREHINLAVLRNPQKFTIFKLSIEGELARPDLRMTVDTKDDWRRVAALFKSAEAEPWKISLHEAIKRMDRTLVR